MKIRSEKSCSKTIPECFSLELKLMYLILCTTYMYFYHFFLMYSVRSGWKNKKGEKNGKQNLFSFVEVCRKIFIFIFH